MGEAVGLGLGLGLELVLRSSTELATGPDVLDVVVVFEILDEGGDLASLS